MTTLGRTRHGIHVPRAWGATEVEWLGEPRRFDRVRVSAHTCWCKATMYELCHAGGLAFVRRTLQREPHLVVSDSHPMLSREADDLWQMIITGEAK